MALLPSSGCDSRHLLYVDQGGSFWACGDNSRGQLGIGSLESQPRPVEVPWEGARVKQIALGEFFSAILDLKGQVWFSGLAGLR